MITSAAVRARINGELVTIPCHRHHQFFRIMKALHCDYDKNSVEQGFLYYDPMEEKELFVNREDAFRLAQKCGQIDKEKAGKTLFSEDIW